MQHLTPSPGSASGRIGLTAHRSRRTPALLLLPLAGLLAGCAITRDMLYAPRTNRVTVDQWAHGAPTPVTVRTAGDQTVEGYYWRGAPADPDIFVFFHGRHFNADIAAKYAQYLLGRGDAVLVASYRGFGPNKGGPSEAHMMEDATAFLAEARRLAGDKARVWLVGHSIGAAVAIHVAARDPAVKGIFALSSFTRVAEAAPRIARAFIPDRWDNRDALPAVKAPILFFQGGEDQYIPRESGPTLLAAAGGPALLLFGAQARHSPDMTVLGPWISAAAGTLAGQPIDKLPPAPSGWVKEAQRP